LPLRTALGDEYLDGGSVGLILVDASGTKVEFMWDYGMGTPPEDRGRLLIRRSGGDFEPLDPTSPDVQAGALLAWHWLRREYSEEVLSRLEKAPPTYGDEYRVYLAQRLSNALLEAD
jgi:hypothetical protein